MPKEKDRKKAEKEIRDFFNKLNRETEPRKIKQIKKLAMHNNIKLGSLRKKFCKKCYSPRLKVKRIKNKIKTVECRNCGLIMRWRIK